MKYTLNLEIVAHEGDPPGDDYRPFGFAESGYWSFDTETEVLDFAQRIAGLTDKEVRDLQKELRKSVRTGQKRRTAAK